VSFYVKDNPVKEFPRLTHFGYCWDDSGQNIPPHVHLGYEIVYLESGHGEIVVKDGDAPRKLEADDVLITRPRVRHRFVVHGDNLVYIWFGLQTDPLVFQTPEHRMKSFPLLPPSSVDHDWLGDSLFREIFENLGQAMGEKDSLVVNRVPEISRAVNNLREEVSGERTHRASLIYSSLIEIFSRLSRRLEYETLPGPNIVLNRILDYIRAHSAEPLSLEMLSEYSGYTPAYLSRLFPKITGLTMSRYIEKVRLSRARILLVQGYQVAETAKRTGFSSGSYFIRRFSDTYGISPGKWREK